MKDPAGPGSSHHRRTRESDLRPRGEPAHPGLLLLGLPSPDGEMNVLFVSCRVWGLCYSSLNGPRQRDLARENFLEQRGDPRRRAVRTSGLLGRREPFLPGSWGGRTVGQSHGARGHSVASLHLSPSLQLLPGSLRTGARRPGAGEGGETPTGPAVLCRRPSPKLRQSDRHIRSSFGIEPSWPLTTADCSWARKGGGTCLGCLSRAWNHPWRPWRGRRAWSCLRVHTLGGLPLPKSGSHRDLGLFAKNSSPVYT